MALRARFYGDPSNTVDEVRRVERKMKGCGKCRHDERVFGVKVCLKDVRPDADGYCERWTEKV